MFRFVTPNQIPAITKVKREEEEEKQEELESSKVFREGEAVVYCRRVYQPSLD